MKAILSRIAGALLLLFIVASASTQEPELLDPRASRDRLLLAFERADRASTLEQWLDTLQHELSAVPAWEAALLREETEKRFARWLRGHRTPELPAPDLRAFLLEIEAANLTFLFDTEDGGAGGPGAGGQSVSQANGILRDGQGDPILRSAESYESDHQGWSEAVEASMEEILARWEREAQVCYQELLGSMDSRLADAVAPSLRVSLADYRQEVRRELDRLQRQAESGFLAARLTDSYSLRHKSEAKTAAELARGLIESTGAKLAAAENALPDGPDGQGDHGKAPLSLDPRDWEAQFQREFERGIEAWDQAEQDFLQERLRWESDARYAYQQAEDVWQAAFEEFEGARQSWLDQMRVSLEAGRSAWDEAQAEFARQYRSVMEGLAASSQRELQKLSDEISALTGVYHQSVALVELADENIEFLREEIQRLQSRGDPGAQAALQALREELAYWQGAPEAAGSDGDPSGGIRGRYLEAAQEARRSLFDLEVGIRSYGGQDLPTGPLEREIARLEAELRYLTGQVAVAEEVLRYATERGPSRPTAAQTAAEYLEAQELFDRAEQSYRQAADALEAFQDEELDRLPLSAQTAREELAEAESGLARARQAYQAAWSAWRVKDARTFETLIEQYTGAIDRYYGRDREKQYRDYIVTWEAYTRASLRTHADELIRDLHGEGELDEHPDAAALEDKARKLSTLCLDWSSADTAHTSEELRLLLADAGVPADSRLLAGLLGCYGDALAGDELARERAAYFLQRLQEQAELALYRNQELVRLLQRETLPAVQAEAELEAVLAAPLQAELLFQRARAWLELRAIRLLQEGGQAEDRVAGELAALLPRLYGDDAPDRSAETEGGGIGEGAGRGPQRLAAAEAQLAAALAALDGLLQGTITVAEAAELPELRSYLAGSSLWVAEGFDYRDGFLTEERVAFERATELAALYTLYGSMSPALAAYYRRRDSSLLSMALGYEPGSSAGEQALEDEEQQPRFLALDTVADPESRWQLLGAISGLGSLPPYLQDILVRLLAVQGGRSTMALQAPSGSSLQGAPDPASLEAELRQAGALYELLQEPEADLLSKAGALLRFGLEGSDLFLAAVLRDYIQQRRVSDSASGEADQGYLSEALLLAGLEGEAISLADLADLADVTDSRLASFFSALTAGEAAYVRFLDGEPYAFIESIVPGADAFTAARLATIISHPDQDGQSLRLPALDEYLRCAAGMLAERLVELGGQLHRAGLEIDIAGVETRPDHLEQDLAAYGSLLAAALAAYASEDWTQQATYDSAAQARLAALEGERSALEWQQGREQAKEAYSAWQSEFDDYEQVALEPLRSEMESRRAAAELAGARYTEALDALRVASERYLELKAALDEACEGYRQARFELQRIEEIRDYACSGYTLQQLSPEGVLAERRAALERTEESLTVLRSLHRAEPQLGFSERVDPEYQELKEQEKGRLEALQHLVLARERMQGSTEQLQEQLLSASTTMEETARELFLFIVTPGEESGSLAYSPYLEEPSLEGLTDFGGLGDSAFITAARAYFQGESAEVAQRLSTDVTIWLDALASFGSPAAVLRELGFAYYYDTELQGDFSAAEAPRIEVDILSNPNLQTLSGERYLDLGWQRFLWWEYYPEDRLTAEDYLSGRAEKVYQEVTADAAKKKLYDFFKAMVATGHFRPGTEFIGDDLSDAAYRYIDGKVAEYLQRYDHWWCLFHFAKVREIKYLRSRLAAAHQSGAAERDRLAAGARDMARDLQTSLASQNALEGLLGASSQEPVTAEGFLRALAEQTGRDANAELRAIVTDSFPGLNAAQRRGQLAALEAIRSETEQRLELTRQKVALRSATLAETCRDRQNRYLASLYAPVLDIQELQEAARLLFLNPPYTLADHADSELAYAKSIETYTQSGETDRLQEIGRALQELAQYRFALIQESEGQKLQLQLRELCDRRLGWERQLDELLGVGLREWKEGATRLARMYESWQEQLEEEYLQKETMWEAKYLLLLGNRDRWIEESANAAVTCGTEAIALEIGLELDRLAAEVETVHIADFSGNELELQAVIRRAFGGNDLGEILAEARALSARGERERVVVAALLPELWSGADALRSAGELTAGIVEEVHSRAALVVALQLSKTVQETEQAIQENIGEANRSMERNLGDLLQGSGYRRSGSLYRRLALIDKTLFGGMEEEAQSVPVYLYFVAPAFDSGVDLSRATLEGQPGEYIQAMVSLATENLARYMELIFGRQDQPQAGWDWAGINEEFRGYFEAQQRAFLASAGYNRKGTSGQDEGKYLFHDTDGLFYFHIGYEPVMSREDPEQVEQPGHGQLGIIMEQFLRNEARQARGLALIEVPWYNLRMWDDDANNDGQADGFSAPSVRSAANLAVSIAATASGNAWLALALNLTDDALFTMADMSSGFVTFEEGMLSLGKQALIGLTGTGIGAGTELVGDALGAFGESVIGKTLLQGTRSLATNAAGSAIDAVTLGRDGKLLFDLQQYKDSLFGWQALSMYAGTVTGAFMEGNLEGFSQLHAAQVKSFAGLVGGLTQAGIEYAATGETTLNLLNFNTLGLDVNGRRLSGGLLECRIAEDGATLGLGQGGADVSPTALVSAMRGFDTWTENLKIRYFDLLRVRDYAEDYSGHRQAGTALRALYSFGDEEQGRALYEELLAGDTMLHIGFGDVQGQTITIDGARHVYLASLGNRSDQNSRLLAGVTLQHEAFRDGYRSNPAAQLAETLDAVVAHSLAALKIDRDPQYRGFLGDNASLSRDVKSLLVSIRSGSLLELARHVGAKYDFSNDYWRLVVNSDGTRKLIDDGESSLYLENGFRLENLDQFTKEESLAIILGAIDHDEYQDQIEAVADYVREHALFCSTETLACLLQSSFQEALVNSLDFSRIDGPLQQLNAEGAITLPRLGDGVEFRIGLYGILASHDVNEATFGKIVSRSIYTGEKSGWYVDFSALAEQQRAEPPTIHAGDEPLIAAAREWFTNFGVSMAAVYGTLNYYSTSRDATEHRDALIQQINSLEFYSIPRDDLAATPTRCRTGPEMDYDSTPEMIASALEMGLSYFVGAVQSFTNGTYLYLYGANGFTFSSMLTQDPYGIWKPVAPSEILGDTAYWRMYEYFNMGRSFRKVWRSITSFFVGW